jgi:hypothetical protein
MGMNWRCLQQQEVMRGDGRGSSSSSSSSSSTVWVVAAQAVSPQKVLL